MNKTKQEPLPAEKVDAAVTLVRNALKMGDKFVVCVQSHSTMVSMTMLDEAGEAKVLTKFAKRAREYANERLTAERDTAISAAVDAEREACASVCESEADNSDGWAKVRLIEVANMLRRNIRARAKP